MIVDSQFSIRDSGFEIPFDQSHLIFKAALQRGSVIIPSPYPFLPQRTFVPPLSWGAIIRRHATHAVFLIRHNIIRKDFEN
jgi:hypothetical protein